MSDVYKIGVSIILANGMSPVLAVISRDLLGIHQSVSSLTKGFEAWKPTLVGVSEVLGGAAILGVMNTLASKAADFQDAMTKVSQLNPKVAALVNNGDLSRLSFGVAQTLGMNVEDVTKVYGGIYGVLQDPQEAESLTRASHAAAALSALTTAGLTSWRSSARRPGSRCPPANPPARIIALRCSRRSCGRLAAACAALRTASRLASRAA